MKRRSARSRSHFLLTLLASDLAQDWFSYYVVHQRAKLAYKMGLKDTPAAWQHTRYCRSIFSAGYWHFIMYAWGGAGVWPAVIMCCSQILRRYDLGRFGSVGSPLGGPWGLDINQTMLDALNVTGNI